MTQNLENTVYDVKDLLEENLMIKLIQNSLYHYPFVQIINGNLGSPYIEIEYMNETKIFSPKKYHQ